MVILWVFRQLVQKLEQITQFLFFKTNKMNSHFMDFRQLVQKLEQITPFLFFKTNQNEWSVIGFPSTGSKVRMNNTSNFCSSRRGILIMWVDIYDFCKAVCVEWKTLKVHLAKQLQLQNLASVWFLNLYSLFGKVWFFVLTAVFSDIADFWWSLNSFMSTIMSCI